MTTTDGAAHTRVFGRSRLLLCRYVHTLFYINFNTN